MRAMFVFVLVLTIVWALIGIGAWIVVAYQNNRDLDAVMNRAQVAADAEDMEEYLVEYKTTLEKRGLTHGHFVLIFKRPDTDYALHLRAVTKLLGRLELLKSLDKASAAYQTGLDDCRGIARELEFIADGTTWVTLHWMLWVLIVLVLLCVVTLVAAEA